MTVHDEQGALTDIYGEPFYISLEPIVGSDQPGVDVSDLAPGLEISVNGSHVFLFAGKAWGLGLGLMRAAVHAERVPADLAKTGVQGATATVSFRIAGLPRIELDPPAGFGVGVSIMSASVSAVHDASLWRHLVGTRGMSAQEAIELLKGIQRVNVQQFLESDKTRI